MRQHSSSSKKEGNALGEQKQGMVWLPLKHLDLIIVQSGQESVQSETVSQY